MDIAGRDARNAAQVGAGMSKAWTPRVCERRCDPGHSSEGGGHGLMVATDKGWVCPACGSEQAFGQDDATSNPDHLSDILAGRAALDRLTRAQHEYRALYVRMEEPWFKSEPARARALREVMLNTLPFMIGSLNRRELSMQGVHASSDGSTLCGNAAWIEMPATDLCAMVAQSRGVFQIARSVIDAGPGEEGFGCGARLDIVVGGQSIRLFEEESRGASALLRSVLAEPALALPADYTLGRLRHTLALLGLSAPVSDEALSFGTDEAICEIARAVESHFGRGAPSKA